VSTKLIVTGGFLGAGKTTLLWQAARELVSRGRKVGLITNDQAPDLVDTSLLARQGLDVREVAGSCFCCNFQGLIDAAETLQSDVRADVLLAEPVGSCTDLSATILQPLKEHFKQRFELAPLSVLADPNRVRRVLSGRDSSLHPSAAYVLKKQLEEADWILINKVDLLDEPAGKELEALLAKHLPDREVKWISAQTGQGLSDWLDEALEARRAGTRVVDIDYDRYAEGEAVLGWLNAEAHLTPPEGGGCDWAGFLSAFMDGMREEIRAEKAAVGHLKVFLANASGELVANLVDEGADVTLRGQVQDPAAPAELVINARVEMPPDELRLLVTRQLTFAASRWNLAAIMGEIRSIRPGRPEPTHRYSCVFDG
jgi:G3E family GTPase